LPPVFCLITMHIKLFSGKIKSSVNNNNVAKNIPNFYKWRVSISVTKGGHMPPAALKRSGRFFAKSAKNLKVKILL
jgi:hypothetical protein